MIAISRMAVKALEDENGYTNGTPVDWWKKINGRVVGVCYV